METEYPVVGAGATGLAFTDTLVHEADVDVTLVDHRPAPGGHWSDAYPFVRLHTPSAYYGVGSLPLGADRIDSTGENAGFYERATGREVMEHFAEAARRLVGMIAPTWSRAGTARDRMHGVSLDAEAGARATDLDELFDRLEASGRLMRIDPSRPATMYRGTMLSAGELHAVREIEDVVRLGHVRRIETDRIVLEHGEVDTGPGLLHVDCTALGLRRAPATPVFRPGRIVLQQVRYLSPCFNAALSGYVEAHRDHDVEKNRLCPPNPYPSSVHDWPGMVTRGWTAEQRWSTEPDVAGWIAASRLNLLRALPDHAAEPAVAAAIKRYVTHVGEALERLPRLDGG